MTSAKQVTVAVLGLGEAGGEIARDLVSAGALVRAYDPAVPAPDGTTAAVDEADAATGADLVLSATSATPSAGAQRAGITAVGDGVWADLNTASPGAKARLARIAADHGVAFADVAIMAPVPGRGLHTPMLASGPAAADVARILNPLGASVDVLDGPPGLAAERKLLRSVFFKGMAAAVVEALDAGRAAGCEEWLRGVIAEELAGAGESTVDRLVVGTRRHAVRRAHEMAAATEMLTELGVEPTIAAASRDLLARLAAVTRSGRTPTGP